MNGGGYRLGQVGVRRNARESPVVMLTGKRRQREGVLHGVLQGVRREGGVCHYVLLKPDDPGWWPSCKREGKDVERSARQR